MAALTHEQVNKVVAHTLRHEPWLCELDLDDEGWVALDDLLVALHAKGDSWARLTVADLTTMVQSSPKRRPELGGIACGPSSPTRRSRWDGARPPGP